MDIASFICENNPIYRSEMNPFLSNLVAGYPFPRKRFRFFSQDLKTKSEQAKVESSTPNRTSCSCVNCSAFIPNETIRGDTAICTECSIETCVICRAAALVMDCNHIRSASTYLSVIYQPMHCTFRCGAKFWYVRSIEWNECDCEQWNEDRLVARANRR
jgi:hypothetical protein